MEYLAAASGSLLFPWVSDRTGVPAAIALAAGAGAVLALAALALGGGRAIADHERARLAAVALDRSASPPQEAAMDPSEGRRPNPQ
jgi:hypothetical protein